MLKPHSQVYGARPESAFLTSSHVMLMPWTQAPHFESAIGKQRFKRGLKCLTQHFTAGKEQIQNLNVDLPDSTDSPGNHAAVGVNLCLVFINSLTAP